jgi:hypothetical protein
MFWSRLLLGSSLLAAVVVSAFVSPRHLQPSLTRTILRQSRLFLSSREEEIARLEKQLRELREQEDEKKIIGDSTTTQKLTREEAEISRRLEKIQGKEMLLSERELLSDGIVEEEGESSRGGSLVGVIGTIVAVVAVIAFSQIPVGRENLARYSATGSSAIKTIDLGDINPDRKE